LSEVWLLTSFDNYRLNNYTYTHITYIYHTSYNIIDHNIYIYRYKCDYTDTYIILINITKYLNLFIYYCIYLFMYFLTFISILFIFWSIYFYYNTCLYIIFICICPYTSVVSIFNGFYWMHAIERRSKTALVRSERFAWFFWRFSVQETKNKVGSSQGGPCGSWEIILELMTLKLNSTMMQWSATWRLPRTF
jgi:hypothetical protein